MPPKPRAGPREPQGKAAVRRRKKGAARARRLAFAEQFGAGERPMVSIW